MKQVMTTQTKKRKATQKTKNKKTSDRVIYCATK